MTPINTLHYGFSKRPPSAHRPPTGSWFREAPVPAFSSAAQRWLTTRRSRMAHHASQLNLPLYILPRMVQVVSGPAPLSLKLGGSEGSPGSV